MKRIINDFNEIINDIVYKIILSRPDKNNPQFQKIVINKIASAYQIEQYTKTQVFHKNTADIIMFLKNDTAEFNQINLWDDEYEYTVKRIDGSFYLISKNPSSGKPAKKETHNREKKYIIPPNTVIPPLVDIGVLTPKGEVIPSKYDKFKQINRFLEMLNDTLCAVPKNSRVNVIDFGCGKSYLTFVTYYCLNNILNLDAHITGLDLKEQVINNCNEIAQKYGYSKLHFQCGDIADYHPPGKVDIVISLHACDTATDYALFNAVNWNAKYIFSVPCCQHEVNKSINSLSFPLLMKYGIVKDRMSTLITDAVRGNMLVYSGYNVQLMEFVDLSHTPKNIMIRAVKSEIPLKTKQNALLEVEQINNEFQIKPALYRLLMER